VASVEAAEPIREDADTPPAPVAYQGGPVEFDRVVPASGNLAVRGKQFWLGPARAGVTVTFWADHDVIHLSIAGARVKTVRSHLSTTDLAALTTTGGRPAGPSPLPQAQPGAVLEVDRTVSQGGLVSLGQHRLLAAEILSGRRVSIRIETATLMFFDPTPASYCAPDPTRYDQARKLCGARPAGPPPPERRSLRAGPSSLQGAAHRGRDRLRRPWTLEPLPTLRQDRHGAGHRLLPPTRRPSSPRTRTTVDPNPLRF
jgi:hypothetical protein